MGARSLHVAVGVVAVTLALAGCSADASTERPLTDVLAAAQEQDIPIISYDRLILDSDAIDYYVTFDNCRVGVQQGTSLLVGLGVINPDGSRRDVTGPLDIELFAGSLDDNNPHVFWQGAMDTLQPYLDEGTLVVRSGQTTIDEASTVRWDGETAYTRMTQLLAMNHTDGTTVDGVLSANDGLARDLAEAAVSMVHAILRGALPEANDTTSYDNGVMTAPSYLLSPQLVAKENYLAVLVGGGYYTADELD